MHVHRRTYLHPGNFKRRRQQQQQQTSRGRVGSDSSTPEEAMSIGVSYLAGMEKGKETQGDQGR